MTKPINREAWLNAFAKAANKTFKQHKHPLPKEIRMSCAFTSGGSRGKSIGECWYKEGSEDGHCEIFIHPRFADSLEVAAILVHELCHAALGNGVGHGPRFKTIARAMKLEGPLTATTGGEEFNEWASTIIEKIGEYPHASLNGSISAHPKRKQPHAPHRNLNCYEDGCGFHAKVRKDQMSWGRVKCPVHNTELLTYREAKAEGLAD